MPSVLLSSVGFHVEGFRVTTDSEKAGVDFRADGLSAAIYCLWLLLRAGVGVRALDAVLAQAGGSATAEDGEVALVGGPGRLYARI